MAISDSSNPPKAREVRIAQKDVINMARYLAKFVGVGNFILIPLSYFLLLQELEDLLQLEFKLFHLIRHADPESKDILDIHHFPSTNHQ